MNSADNCSKYESIIRNLPKDCETNCVYFDDGECIHKYGYMCNSHKQNREMEGKE